MKEELTREVVEAMAKCSHSVGCKDCAALCFCNGKLWSARCKNFAAALLEERDKPKVWDGAPDDALQAQITWFTKNGGYIGMKTYTRELPKTRARKNAEELYKILCFQRTGKTDCINAIESALEKYAAELGTAT